MHRRQFIKILPGILALAQRRPAPDFSLQDLAGNNVSSSMFRGKVVLLDFWATWCEPCLADIPILNMLKVKYENRGFEVVAVTLESGSADEIRRHAKLHGINYTVLIGNDSIANKYNVIGFPIRYLITRDGRIHKKFTGSPAGKEKGAAAEIEREVQILVAAP